MELLSRTFGIASGTINAKGDVGTLVAYLEGTCNLNNCYNKANVNASEPGYSTGGLIATAHIGTITMKKCYNTGKITNVSATAGMVGFVWGATTVTLEECYNSGAIESTATQYANTAVAGLIVKDSGSAGRIVISKCYNSGSVKGYSRVGGLISSSNGPIQITDSYNIGTITSTMSATASYSSTNAVAGGILAYKNTSSTVNMTNVYSAGTISATKSKGGIVGYNASGTTTGITYNRTYFLNTNSATSTYGGTAMTAADMQLESFVTTLNNGSSNWKFNSGGYPRLSWQ